jgi:hypothetical protein
MSEARSVYDVTSASVFFIRRDPPALKIVADGDVQTGGWQKPTLVEVVYVAPPTDGFWEYKFEAVPPAGKSPDVITPVHAETVRESVPKGFKGVRIVAETNKKDARAPGS